MSDAPETRMNRGGDFSNYLQKGSFCRECRRKRRFLLGNVMSCVAAILFAFPQGFT